MRGSVSWLSRDLAGRRNRATIGFSDTPFQTESPPVLQRGLLLAKTQLERDDVVLPEGGGLANNRYYGTRRTGQCLPGAWHKELRMRISITRPRFYWERPTVATTVRGRQGVTLAEADISAGRILLGTPRYDPALTSRLIW